MKSAEPYRFDIVTDRYVSESLKEGIRDNIDSGRLVFLFNDSRPFPENLKQIF